MNSYPVKSLASILQAKLIGNQSLICKHIFIDSRSIDIQNGSAFFAIPGQNHNGHDFIEALYSRGVRIFIISQANESFFTLENAAFLQVSNTIQALQTLVTHHRNNFNIPIIGITGSNGKTIIKEWLAHCLLNKYTVTRNPKSYNSQVGVPLSVWYLNEKTEMGIFEAGISKPNEMSNLKQIIQPTIGIFTNIGNAHQENFESIEEKVKEKLHLFVEVNILIHSLDQPNATPLIVNFCTKNSVKAFTWSKCDKTADIFFNTVNSGRNKTSLVYTVKGVQKSATIPFTDEASIENVSHVIACLEYLKYNEIEEVLKDLPSTAMRLERLKGVRGNALINDVYNSDINSIKIALDFLNMQRQGDKVLILSDIDETGTQDEILYYNVAQLIEKSNISHAYCIGPKLKANVSVFSKLPTSFYESTADFLKSKTLSSISNKNILVKGARRFRFEQIIKVLEEKQHSTILEINLNNMVDNLNYFRSLLQAETKIMVMAKALSYGSGSKEIAEILQHEQVDYLGVAFADEGVELRDAGIELPVLVLSPSHESFDTIIDYKLEPEIYNLKSLQVFAQTLSHLQEQQYPIHIKIDTGMHRLGFSPKEIPFLLEELHKNPQLHVKSVFSHLAASDDSAEDEFTLNQIALLTKIHADISNTIGYKPMKHILNSSGIERFPQAHFDMVRLGIGLHSISQLAKLNAVACLKTIVSQVKELTKGETIGYNRRGKAGENCKIAIIPIGYADGLDRRFGNGTGNVWIKNKEYPFIGSICMDMSMIDISNADINEGDEVEIFGNNISISKQADKIGTIPYEILTNVSQRVKRLYYRE